MCRLFGCISSHKIDADWLLSKAPQSLLRQSDIDRKRKQGDGWGFGWFEKGGPKVFKSPKPMYEELRGWNLGIRKGKSFFKKGLPFLTSNPQSRPSCVIGHVRWASNP